jgi:hypothetical protein
MGYGGACVLLTKPLNERLHKNCNTRRTRKGKGLVIQNDGTTNRILV